MQCREVTLHRASIGQSFKIEKKETMAINGEHASIILKRLFDSKDPYEQIVLISGQDKQRIPIHRVILNAASKYFTGLFGPNFHEGKPKEFLLDDSDGGTIKTVVNFCYTGNVDLSEENVENILKIAFNVGVDLLEDKCRQFYAANLSVANAVSVWMMADKYRFGDLHEQAFQLILDNFEMLPTTDVHKLSHPLLVELLKYDKIQGLGDLCAMRLLEWFQCDEDERDVFMPELLKLVRLEQLTTEFLNNTLEAVFKRFKCSDLVNAEYKRRLISQPVDIRDCSNVANAEYGRKTSSRDLINDGLHSRSTFCVFLQYEEEDGVRKSEIKIEKYNNMLNCFEKATEIPMGQRICFGVVLHKNKIFVLGGFASLMDLRSVSSYDLSSRNEEVLPEMNVARVFFTSISLGKFIYVFGGLAESGTLSSCERFNTENNTWETLNSMNVARSSASATVLNGYIYIAGGWSAEDSLTTSFELYDPKTDEWTQLAPMTKPRGDFALMECNGYLYAIGGDEVIERFHPYTNRWTEIGSLDDSVQISNAINIDGKLFAIMINGRFGRVEIDDSGNCSFVLLNDSKYKTDYFGRHFLYHV